MVLEFGLLKTSLLDDANQTAYGINTPPQPDVIAPYLPSDFWYSIIPNRTAITDGHLLCFTTQKWAFTAGASCKKTVDAGVTWTDATTDIAGVQVCAHSRTLNSLKGVAGMSGDKLRYTIDAGDNWTACTMTAMANEALQCVDIPSDTRGVIGIAKVATARTIAYSADLITWTLCTTGPAISTFAISMFDNNTGYAVDSSANIWKTTNGGVDWTDTTDNMTSVSSVGPSRNTIIAISATKVLLMDWNARCELYDNTAHTLTKKFNVHNAGVPANGLVNSNFVKCTNGNIYIFRQYITAVGTHAELHVWRSIDQGVSFTLHTIPSPAISLYGATLMGCNTQLNELANTNVLCAHTGGGDIIKFPG